LNHRKKTKADGSRLIPQKHTETLVLLSVTFDTNETCAMNQSNNATATNKSAKSLFVGMAEWECTHRLWSQAQACIMVAH